MVLIRRSDATKYGVTRNRQWSITALHDLANGSVVERYAYEMTGKRTIYAANGTTVRTTSTYGNNFGYTNRWHDEESGLMYFRARYYNPITGEFLSRDPMEFVDGMSLYRGYFGIGGVDPIGLEWIILRNGGAKAEAIPTDRNDTISDLAKLIGLRETEAEHWLSVNLGNANPGIPFQPDDPIGWTYCDLPTFQVPNTIYQVWVGEEGDFGQWWSGFWVQNAKYEAAGYKVDGFDFRSYFSRDDQKGTNKRIREKIIGDISQLRNERALHGLHVTGHGFPYGFQTDSYKFKSKFRLKKKKSDSAVFYSEIQGRYRLGIVHLFVCEGGWSADDGRAPDYHDYPDSHIVGGRDLFSEMPPPADFDGKKGTFYPTMGASNPWK